jgi:PAS domain S-box-containing protein
MVNNGSSFLINKEVALKENHSFVELLLNSPAIAAMTSGPDHTFVMTNANYLKIIGNKDVIGKTVREARPEFESQGIIKILDQVYRTGLSFSANEILVSIDINGDGKLSNNYLNLVYQAYKNSEGEIEGIVLFANDVTELVHSRKKAEESERMYRQIVETSQEGIWMIDKMQRTTFVNKTFCDLLGYSSEEMLGKENTFFMDEEGKGIADTASETRELGRKETIDISLITKSGKKVWATLSGTTFVDEEGNFNGGLAMVMDITERRLAQEKVKLSEQRFRLLIENSADLLTLMDKEAMVSYISPSAERVLGYSLSECVGQSAFQIIHRDNIDTSKTALQEALENPGKHVPLEFRNRKKDGQYILLEATLINMLDAPGINQVVINSRDITQRKEAEEVIRKSEALLAEAQHIAQYGNWNFNLSTGTLSWSDELYNVFGVEKGKFHQTFESLTGLIDENDRDQFLKVNRQLQTTGEPFEMEYCVTTSSGEKRIICDKAFAEHDANGKVTRVYGAAQNITERKKSEARIRESEAKYHAFFENSMDAVLLTDAEGQILEANPTAVQLFNMPEDDICAINIFNLFDRNSYSLQVLLDELFSNGSAKGELELQLKDGAKIPCEVAFVTYIEASKEERTSIIIRDITERKAAQDDILRINERYKLSTRATSNALWDWDLLTNNIYWSEGYKSTFGYDVIDAGEHFSSMVNRIHPFDYERVNERILQVIAGNDGVYWEDEYRFLKANGTTAHVYNRGNLIFEQGIPVRFAGAMEDITSRKEGEIERDLLIKELSKSNADLKQFSFITSHNLRAPLSNIAAILTLIDYSTLSKENLQLIEMLKESGEQLSATIEDISNILIIKNNINIHVTSINLETIYAEISKSFLIELKNINGSVFTNFEVSQLNFHRTYIESIFINLISNAIKYRSPYRPLILRITSHKDDNGNCILTFADNGIGIDLKRHRDRVFGLYQRFNDKIEGHGLGLFIVKSQITALGGTIEIESEVDKGTSFIITLKGLQIE